MAESELARAATVDSARRCARCAVRRKHRTRQIRTGFPRSYSLQPSRSNPTKRRSGDWRLRSGGSRSSCGSLRRSSADRSAGAGSVPSRGWRRQPATCRRPISLTGCPRVANGDELDDLSQSFNGLLDRLQESFERQRRFTGDASHQLLTPLTAILGQLEVRCAASARPRSIALSWRPCTRRRGAYSTLSSRSSSSPVPTPTRCSPSASRPISPIGCPNTSALGRATRGPRI